MRRRAGCQDKPSQYRRVDNLTHHFTSSPIHHFLNSLSVTKTIKKTSHMYWQSLMCMTLTHSPQSWRRSCDRGHVSRVTRHAASVTSCVLCQVFGNIGLVPAEDIDRHNNFRTFVSGLLLLFRRVSTVNTHHNPNDVMLYLVLVLYVTLQIRSQIKSHEES